MTMTMTRPDADVLHRASRPLHYSIVRLLSGDSRASHLKHLDLEGTDG